LTVVVTMVMRMDSTISMMIKKNTKAKDGTISTMTMDTTMTTII